LRWQTVRVMRYRQRHPDGEVVEAYVMAKSRWQIENQGFNDAKNRYALEHICDHHPGSLLIVWLLTCVALILERLYRLRHLHRGTHRALAAIDLLRILLLTLSAQALADSS
jgi:hypothetical protein